jgi:photosystem II stability/assembly factor-like uncharacterized protein
MVKKCTILLSLVILLGLGLISLRTEAKDAWKVVFQSIVKHPCNLVGFLDETYGITVGYSGEIQYTKDSGENWNKAENKSLCRLGLEIVNEKLAWNCGNAGHVRMSNDGGQTWIAVSSFGDMEPDQARFLSFIDNEIGWIASNYRFATTADGGRTWNEIDTPTGNEDIAAIYLRTSNEGFVMDVKGNLYITKDGCKTWSKQVVPLMGEKLVSSRCPMAVMHFSDANNGCILISHKKAIWSYTTTNGGEEWSKEQVSKEHYGFLYLTRDGKKLTITSKKNLMNSKEEATVTLLSR